MTRFDPRTRRPLAIGVVLGCCTAAAVLALVDAGGSRGRVAGGTLLSDCEGGLQELVVHFVPQAAEAVLPTYRDFFAQLPDDATVYVVCPDQAAFTRLADDVGPCPCRLVPVPVAHPLTTWSRDRWLARAGPQDTIRLLTPRTERGAGVWPERSGDHRVAADLAAALGGRVRATRSALEFDGGDFVADAETVFVAPAVWFRNQQRAVASREQLEQALERSTGRRVVLLETAPEHHTGMFLMPVGDRTVLVGDPSAAFAVLDRDDGHPASPGGPLPSGIPPDASRETQQQFDAVADQCRSLGYRVVRIPVLPGDDGRTWLSYLNAILDQRQGRRIVYLPVFAGAPALNAAAVEIWQGLGYEVRPVDCSACAPHFGTLRCLVNVLRRS